ncbi:MAG: Crp/Fnr family transcriptional regulator [Flavobacteriales bacterium]|nr:Crp/Fnr family transcriptional regulator [Flavobacteriales bacterium]
METLVNIEQLLEDKFKSYNSYSANEVIFREGDKIKGIYFIKEGKIKVTRKAKNDMTVWFANPKEFIGLSSFFNNSENYSFSTSAFSGGVNAILIPTKDFKKILDKNHLFKQEIIQILCNRIGSTRKRISNIKFQSIKVRVLNAILFLIDKKDLNKATAKIHYSIRELSELAGTSTQYIKKLITEFQKKKLLKIKGDDLVINMGELNLLVS